MKLKELITRISKEKDNQDSIDYEDFSNDFPEFSMWDISWSAWEERVTAYWVTRWLCTDTWVGQRIIFLDGEAIAYSNQVGRKCGTNICFLSKEAKEKLRKAIPEMMNDGVINDNSGYIDEETEIDTSYVIEYQSQILEKTAQYINGETVYIRRHNPNSWDNLRNVTITFDDGREEIVDCRKLLFFAKLNESC